MRLSAIFISSAFVLAGTSTAFRAERGNMLIARSADSDFISEVYGRAYDEDHKLYARAGSRNNYNRVSRRRRSLYEPPRHVLARRADHQSNQHPTSTQISGSVSLQPAPLRYQPSTKPRPKLEIETNQLFPQPVAPPNTPVIKQRKSSFVLDPHKLNLALYSNEHKQKSPVPDPKLEEGQPRSPLNPPIIKVSSPTP